MKSFVQNVIILSFVFLLCNPAASQQVTGLEGWTIYIDPGHSQKENMGIYNYSEAEKVLRVALALRELLGTQTDIDTVYMSRTNDQQYVTLSQRTDHANTVGADFFYSIHSDAGPPHVNSTLFLYGGWREGGVTIEKTPKGGKKMGDIMNVDLPASMRIPTRGNYADRTFYQGFPYEHDRKYPYLHINRETIMASVLSEGGFHTNPTQNMRNMNAEWKRLEAQSAFWSILTFHDIERPPVGIATGYVTDIENGKPINGATVSINGHSYTTDTYESLFYKYSTDPDLLRNGFYYIENLPYGDTLEMIVQAEGYYPDTSMIVIRSDFFTFQDVALLSSMPPYVVSTIPEDGQFGVDLDEIIRIDFSRKMNRSSVESAFSISLEKSGTLIWASDTRLGFFPDSPFEPETEYTITITDTAQDQWGHRLDGNKDGEPGGDFVFTFYTGEPDLDPPVLVQQLPMENEEDVELHPVISLEFDEEVDDNSVGDDQVRLVSADGLEIDGILKHYVVRDRSVLNFFPAEELDMLTEYTVILEPGLSDRHGNAIAEEISYSFTTGSTVLEDITVIDNFEGGVGNWWHPQQSGSTLGIITEETERVADNEITNVLTGSSTSMRIRYGWDTSASSHLIRVHTPSTSTPASVRFDGTYIVQAYVFGDGSGNRFRFVLRDNSGATPASYEASPWYAIDWIGWKLISWDLAHDPIVAWVGGNGVINPLAFIDSFQLTYTSGKQNIGFVHFDDLRIVKKTVVSVGKFAEVPSSFSLEQNYPNPFNPSTTIRYQIPEQSMVKLEIFNILGQRVEVLVNEVQDGGTYQLQWYPNVASGTYYYRIEAVSTSNPGKRFIRTRSMVFIR